MAKDAPMHLVTPDASFDRPSWVRVGAIAAVGFVIGVAWPRLAGVRLAPRTPGSATTQVAPPAVPEAPPSGAAAAAPAAAPEPRTPAPAAAPAPEPVAPAEPPGVVSSFVLKASVLSCRTGDGDTKKGKECGTPNALEGAIGAKLRRLPSSCPAAAAATGKVSFVVTADFGSKTPSIELGRSSGLQDGDAVLACAKGALSALPLAGLAHDHPRYVLAYLGERKETAAPAAAPAEPAGKAQAPGDRAEPRAADARGGAEIVWDAALVRDQPSGAVVGRLPKGTRVDVRGTKGGWYEVVAGETRGWVYRSALGR